MCRVGTFFFNFRYFFVVFQKCQYFSYQKKEKQKKNNFAATQVAIISATRWTGNKLFFKCGLRGDIKIAQMWCDSETKKQLGIKGVGGVSKFTSEGL